MKYKTAQQDENIYIEWNISLANILNNNIIIDLVLPNFTHKLHTPADEEVYTEVTVLWEDHQHQQVVKI